MYDLTIIGNAPVDALYAVDDDLLAAYNLQKGDWQRLPNAVYDDLMATLAARGVKATLQPGGSGANTAWHLARMGHKVFFAGLVGDDTAGRLFYDSLRAAGADMTPPVPGLHTFVLGCLITPDGERTFISDGRCPNFGPEHLPLAAIANTRYLMLEGYLLGTGYPALSRAAELAEASGAKLIVTLAAPSFVRKYCDQIVALLGQAHAVLFLANDEELETLQRSLPSLKDPALIGSAMTMLSMTDHVVTHGKRGAEYYSGGYSLGLVAPARSVPNVVDATGAGDAFAAGFLHLWMTNPKDVTTALQTGHTLAGKVIAHLGGRPDVRLDD
jgi:sugar/nucleoside kinase (ribokinase family)